MPATTEYKLKQTDIPGLLEIDIASLSDPRGYFQEKFQREKLVAQGFPADFAVVQQNISQNIQKGVLRGIHAEPWDKYVSVIAGKVFAAWVDLRKESFGKIHTTIIDENKAVFVPRGVANSYQILVDGVYYSYLVNAHWKPDATYKAVNPFDPALSIHWPIDPGESIISEKDKNNPNLSQVEPFIL